MYMCGFLRVYLSGLKFLLTILSMVCDVIENKCNNPENVTRNSVVHDQLMIAVNHRILLWRHFIYAYWIVDVEPE